MAAVNDWPALITAGVGVISTLGGGIAWLWVRVERRFTAVEEKLADCQKREKAHQETAGKHLIVIELLWQEVTRRTKGASPVLERCGELLDDLKEKKS